MVVPPKFTAPVVSNPPMTLDVIKQMPKCDLDCRLIGSTPLELILKYLTESIKNVEFRKSYLSCFSDEQLKAISTLNGLKEFIYSPNEEVFHGLSKKIAIAALQTIPALKEATTAIIEAAAADNVTYMELTVSPLHHTKLGLSNDDVLEAILGQIKETCDRLKTIEVHVVLNVSIKAFSPLEVREVAELAVKYQEKGVIGFATTTQEIGPENYRYFADTFEFLKKNYINVCMFVGERNPASVPIALCQAGARRISGGFRIAQNDAVLNEITSHNVTVMVSDSKRFRGAEDSWTKSPVRFFRDLRIKVTYCSIHNTFNGKTRSEQLFEIAKNAQFDTVDVMHILGDTYKASFLHLKQAEKLQAEFYVKARKILEENGYKRLDEMTYFK